MHGGTHTQPVHTWKSVLLVPDHFVKQPVNSEPGDKQKILMQWKLSHNTHTANSTRVCPLTGVLKLTHKDLHTFTHDASKINDPKIRNKYFLFEMRQTHAEEQWTKPVYGEGRATLPYVSNPLYHLSHTRSNYIHEIWAKALLVQTVAIWTSLAKHSEQRWQQTCGHCKEAYSHW